MMMRSLATLILLLLTASPAWSWGGPGHQAIAEATQGHLNDRAKIALAAIILETDSLPPGALAGVARWPDELRGNAPAGWGEREKKEAKRFNQDHPTNADWHFVNLPLGASAYPAGTLADDDPMREFVRDDDIVHAINRAIAILESPSPSPTYSKTQAVRLLVHLVGDIHQPCHATAGYYDPALPTFKTKPVRIDDPTRAGGVGVLKDRGGNGLKFSDNTKLHGVWDGCLANVVVLKPPYSQQTMMAACNAFVDEYSPLAAVLSAKWQPGIESAYKTPGDHHTWAAVWATESLQQAVKSRIYDVSLRDGQVKTNSHGDDPYVEAAIVTPTKPTYVRAHIAPAEEQLMKATVRLAALLNAIDWK